LIQLVENVRKEYFSRKKIEVNNILIENKSVFFFNNELLKDILNFDRYVLNAKCSSARKIKRKKSQCLLFF